MKFTPVQKSANPEFLLINPVRISPSTSSTSTRKIMETSSVWSWKDYVGQILARTTSARNTYLVQPGLYRLGNPDESSLVLASANYKLSFDKLRKSLPGQNLWILVLDTKGVNVWCAAGKGTFGTGELIRQIQNVRLDLIVRHRKIIVPQLGAPGIKASEVRKLSGFSVIFGPVYARDIIEFIRLGLKAPDYMRKIHFNFVDRIILTPMEFIPAFRYFPWFALPVIFLFSLKSSGLMFHDAILGSTPYLISALASIFAGAFATPVLLPFIPTKSFSIKGWIVGLIMALTVSSSMGWLTADSRFLLPVFVFIFIPAMSSFIALQFTGSTTFTSMSGVKKELRYALPVYKILAAICILLVIADKIHMEGYL
ncbi:MAG: mercury methylation corrinoid protein HgcA [Spirochaetia bacterium]|nr:mercury methylation corrinoid protein HgcA [Spirochaetia bacterium]